MGYLGTIIYCFPITNSTETMNVGCSTSRTVAGRRWNSYASIRHVLESLVKSLIGVVTGPEYQLANEKPTFLRRGYGAK